ncbi:SUMF1/EgtB/PvdO family nonheme iron enzyme [Verrucomicrobiaceae bacterium N1E253]|uniref:SUMF1/EgtB/PvdO family nonheme iron enzyme n=1 Tax=Oceaniferula marina TaxID=2748318 RepID=A0A851GAR1_9BACT|nr:SUMF1/EgtB/PvdO family nonheme iron enzyme [Oceaniferula marina]NWK54703.1 SUMF1/EgtB/PvdO family nonheme iron enzyme [Oceaniferula marina]
MKPSIIASVIIGLSTSLTLLAKPRELNYGTKESLELAIQDLINTHGKAYPKGPAFLKRLKQINDEKDLAKLRKEALMANPAIDFDQLLIIERSVNKRWLPANWQCNSSLPKTGHNNNISTLSLKDGSTKQIFKPEGGKFLGDLELHFDADKIMFSSIGEHGAWAVFEMDLKKGAQPEQITPPIADIDCMDPCYLPDGRIIFASTSGFQGVPCVGGNDIVANLHILDPKTNNIRRICFDQENNWNPTVLPNGKILFQRWEYTDSAHYFSRLLMHMNPDGTNQKEYYGSNSYWPNSMFYARPIPGSSNKFITIVTGHHGVARAGELILFDNNKGRHEADGVIQRIPGRGKKVEPVIKDRLVNGSFPLFLHPYPLSENHFIVSMSLDGKHFGIYLVDTFDNIVPIQEANKNALTEAIPLRKTAKPPVKPDLVRLDQKDATFYIQDIYAGPGLKDVPRGTVKTLKVYTYEYAPRKQGGHYAIGMEGPWDVRTVLGTVPVNKDGSVMFKAPANTPIGFLPLDAEGKALQIMRSWATAMPGEVVSCVGCHEPQNMSPTPRPTMASKMAPKKLTPWLGTKPRGFSFHREIQPVLDESCVGCHTTELAKKDGRPDFEDMKKSYFELHPYVRRNGPEGDYHLLTPLEFHADTSELVQILQKGHYNVKLGEESWEKLITWIDMNVPEHGTWTEAPKGRGSKTEEFLGRRAETRKKYAGLEVNPEVVQNPYTERKKFIAPPEVTENKTKPETSKHWPIAPDKARAMQQGKTPLSVDLGNGSKMTFVYIPKGEFINAEGKKELVKKSYWMANTEVSLEQYRAFQKEYKNGVYDMHYKDQVDRGYYMNDPKFPVIRTNWDEANAFCDWLGKKLGKQVKLPSSSQWEWACRAGSASPVNYGELADDFGKHANLSDVNMKKMAVKGVNPKPIKNPPPHLDFIPKRDDVNDGVLHLAKVGSYQPNIWGLHDMHGNVAEWTSSDYADDKKTVLGGSWRDRPHRAAAGFSLGFRPWQKVYNVGFRVIIEE